MVLTWLVNQLRFKDSEEKPEELVKPTQEKAGSFGEFVKLPETKQFISEWRQKKKFTRRGVEDLLRILWPQQGSNKGIIKAAGNLLSKLTGEDGLLGAITALKIVPEGLMKRLKA